MLECSMRPADFGGFIERQPVDEYLRLLTNRSTDVVRDLVSSRFR